MREKSRYRERAQTDRVIEKERGRKIERQKQRKSLLEREINRERERA